MDSSQTIHMNYNKIYQDLIDNRRSNPIDGYGENHHIIPKSLGGSNDKSNLVRLTAREHFICHLLLVKMQMKNSLGYYKMLTAFLMMHCCHSSNQTRYYSSRQYGHLREEHARLWSIKQLGDGNNRFGTRWIFNPVLQLSRIIKLDDSIPDGWFVGRVLNWNKEQDVLERKQARKTRGILKKAQNAVEREQYRIDLYKEYYQLYVKLGFTKFVEHTGYPKKIWALLSNFKKYVPEYRPHEVSIGKSRK